MNCFDSNWIQYTAPECTTLYEYDNYIYYELNETSLYCLEQMGRLGLFYAVL